MGPWASSTCINAYSVTRSQAGGVPGGHAVMRRRLVEFAVVVLTDDAAVDYRVTITGDELYVTRATGKALEVVDTVLGPHDQLIGWDLLTTGCTCSTRTEYSAGDEKEREYDYLIKYLYNLQNIIMQNMYTWQTKGTWSCYQ